MDTSNTVDPVFEIINGGRLRRAAEDYEPTPQEIRRGQIEYHARRLIGEIHSGGVLGMTGETRTTLEDLAGVIGCACGHGLAGLVHG